MTITKHAKFLSYKNQLVLVFCISLLLCTRLHAQDIGTYRKMLKIVQKHNGGKVILVSDEIPYIDLGGFSDTISKLWHKSVFGAIGEMDSLSRTSPRMLYNRQLLQMSARKGKYSEVLYFGNIYKGLVIAELITVKEKTDLSYSSQAGFNQSLQYLFLIDKAGNIHNLGVSRMNYD